MNLHLKGVWVVRVLSGCSRIWALTDLAGVDRKVLDLDASLLLAIEVFLLTVCLSKEDQIEFSGVRKRVVSKRVVLANVPRHQQPEREYIRMFPGTKTERRYPENPYLPNSGGEDFTPRI